MSSLIKLKAGFWPDFDLLISKNIGANIYSNLLPFSKKTKSLLRSKIVKFDKLLSSGDDYELLFTIYHTICCMLKTCALPEYERFCHFDFHKKIVIFIQC